MVHSIIKNKSVLALAIASSLTLTACGSGGDDASPDGTRDASRNPSLELNLQGAESFVLLGSDTSNQADGYATSLYSSELTAARKPMQCESFMKVVGLDTDGVPQVSSVFDFQNDTDFEEFGVKCEVESAVATESALILQGEFLNFKQKRSEEDKIAKDDGLDYDFMSCSILRVPMTEGDGELKCIAAFRNEKAVGFGGYEYSKLAMSDNLEDIYYSRLTQDDETLSLFKYGQSEKVIGLGEVDMSRSETDSYLSADDKATTYSDEPRSENHNQVHVTNGDYVFTNVSGSYALFDTNEKTGKRIAEKYHAHGPVTKLVDGTVFTEARKNPIDDPESAYGKSIIVRLDSGAVELLDAGISAPEVMQGKDKLWATSVLKDFGFKLAVILKGSDHIKLLNGSEPLMQNYDDLDKLPSDHPYVSRNTGLVSNKVGDTNYAYLTTGVKSDEDRLVVGELRYIDLGTDTYYRDDLLSKLESKFSRVIRIEMYSGGVIITGFSLNGGRQVAYLDQLTMTEYFPTEPVKVVYSQVGILR